MSGTVRALRQHLTYANVMATIAVFIALGGVSWAAVTLPRNSVGTAQLKNGAVSERKLGKGVRTKLTAGAKTGAASIGAPGPAGLPGPKGETGATGAAGAKGDPGVPGTNATVNGVAAGGDLTGTYPNPQLAPNAVKGTDIDEQTLENVVLGRRFAASYVDAAPSATSPATGTVLTIPVSPTGSAVLKIRCTKSGTADFGVDWVLAVTGTSGLTFVHTADGPSGPGTPAGTLVSGGGSTTLSQAPVASAAAYTLTAFVVGVLDTSVMIRASVVTKRTSSGACFGSAEATVYSN